MFKSLNFFLRVMWSYGKILSKGVMMRLEFLVGYFCRYVEYVRGK